MVSSIDLEHDLDPVPMQVSTLLDSVAEDDSLRNSINDLLTRMDQQGFEKRVRR